MTKVFKRIFDITFSLFLLLILLPLLAALAICLKLTSKGEIFFRQERLGLKGKVFKILKFRTMIANALGTGLDSYSDDPRVTKFGRIMRASSLDELPQLINILKGEMSFVGPRPPVTYSPYKYENYPNKEKQRFNLKPGVTGWAQVNGRNNLSWEEKFRFDIEYFEKQSFLFDIKIILLTIVKVIKNEGAFDTNSNQGRK